MTKRRKTKVQKALIRKITRCLRMTEITVTNEATKREMMKEKD
jgi:hypothetical protein